MQRDIGLQMVGACYQQARSGLDHDPSGRDVVDTAQCLLGHADTLGSVGGSHGGGCQPDCPARQPPATVGFKIALKDRCVVPGQQYLRCASGQNDGAVGRWIERLEIFQCYLGQLGGQRNVDVTLDVDGLEVGMVADLRQTRIEGLRVADDVLDGLQFGHVKAGFHRHREFAVAGAQAGALVLGNGPPNAALTPVVGCQCELPVTKHAVKLLQVVERRARGGQHIAPVVAKGVLFQLKVLSGGRHELPHAGGLGARYRLRVERALDEGQQGQFSRHIAPFKFFNNVEQVFARTLGHAQDVVVAAAVPKFAVVHQLAVQIRHGVTASDAFPQVGGRRQRSHCSRGGKRCSDRQQFAADADGGLRVAGPVSGGAAGGCCIGAGALARIGPRDDAGAGTTGQPEQAAQARHREVAH